MGCTICLIGLVILLFIFFFCAEYSGFGILIGLAVLGVIFLITIIPETESSEVRENNKKVEDDYKKTMAENTYDISYTIGKNTICFDVKNKELIVYFGVGQYKKYVVPFGEIRQIDFCINKELVDRMVPKTYIIPAEIKREAAYSIDIFYSNIHPSRCIPCKGTSADLETILELHRIFDYIINKNGENPFKNLK